MNDAEWDRLLKQSLTNEVAPDDKLNQTIVNQLTERSRVKHQYKKRLSAALVAVVLLLVLSVSAYAASQLFSAKQVAERLGDSLLGEAFESEHAIEINESKAAGDYLFTLYGIVSGAGLSQFPHSAEEIYPERTYAVVSIARLDGEPMPSTADPEYGQESFFVSPLIKGLKPWQVNIFTMRGGYSEIVIDGVMYRMIECNQVEMFADRGIYMAFSSGSSSFRKEAFEYDEQTGEIAVKEDYPGAAVLFDVPLDSTKANRAKAEAYLEQLLNPTPEAEPEASIEEEWVIWMQALRAKIQSGESIGETIADSIKEVSYADSGNITYTYEDWSITASPEQLFADGEIGFTDRRLPISGDSDDIYKAALFHKDENGVITGRVVILDKANTPELLNINESQ